MLYSECTHPLQMNLMKIIWSVSTMKGTPLKLIEIEVNFNVNNILPFVCISFKDRKSESKLGDISKRD